MASLTPFSRINIPARCSAALAVGEVVEVLLDGQEQPRGAPHAPEPRGEGHAGNVGPGGGMWGGYGSEQVGIAEAPDPRIAVLAHWERGDRHVAG